MKTGHRNLLACAGVLLTFLCCSSANWELEVDGPFPLETEEVCGPSSPSGAARRVLDVSKKPIRAFADRENSRIYILRPDVALTCVGGLGSNPGEFNTPANVAITPTLMTFGAKGDPPAEMLVYVADSKNHRIQMFDTLGSFVSMFGEYGTGDGQFQTPMSVDVDFDGEIYVVDSGSCTVQVFDSSGIFLRKWGGRGSDHSQFQDPTDILFFRLYSGSKPSDYIAVADHGNSRVQVFRTDGRFVRSLGDIPEVLGITFVWHGSRSLIAVSGSTNSLYFFEDAEGEPDIEAVSNARQLYDVIDQAVTDTFFHSTWWWDWTTKPVGCAQQ